MPEEGMVTLSGDTLWRGDLDGESALNLDLTIKITKLGVWEIRALATSESGVITGDKLVGVEHVYISVQDNDSVVSNTPFVNNLSFALPLDNHPSTSERYQKITGSARTGKVISAPNFLVFGLAG